MDHHFPIDLPATSILLEAIDHTRVGVIVSDPELEDNPIIYTNQGFLQMTGYSYEDILGKNCRFLQGPESSNAAIQKLRDAIEQKESVSVQLVNYKKNGEKFWNELHIDPVYSEEEEKYFFIGVQKDITVQKNAEESLREHNKEIALLSTPIVPVMDKVYVLPLIGNINEDRIKLIFNNVTEAVYYSEIETLILDLSGLVRLDDEVIKSLFTLYDLLNLLGTELLLTGVTPKIAVRSKEVHADLNSFKAFKTVKDAINYKQKKN